MDNQGFSYLEMIISFVIMSIIYIGFISAFSQLTEQDYYQTSQTTMQQIQRALDEYVTGKGYLPCPSGLNAIEGTAAFGTATDCTAAASSGVTDSNTGVNAVRIGGVPFKSLGLSSSMAYDAWNGRIIYAVVRNLATTSVSFTDNTPASAFSIRDRSGNVIASSANTAYVIVSLGKDGKGAYSSKGIMTAVCGTGLQAENCNYDYVFVTAHFNDGKTVNKYDDLVFYKTRAQLIKDNSLAVTP